MTARKLTQLSWNADANVEALMSYIADAGLEPGDRLPPERALAVELGTSRTSLRQAITVLRTLGLLDVRHGNGIYLLRRLDDLVPPLAPDILDRVPELVEIKDLREAIESHAAMLAAQRRTDADLAALAAANARMQDEIDAGGTGIEGDRAFHAAVLAAAHSPVLTDTLARIDAVVARAAASSLARPGQPRRSLETHRMLFEAIVRRAPEEARQIMLDHLLVTGEIGDAED